MKNFYNLFEYAPEHRPIIEEFVNIYNSPDYKTISKKIKFSYKKDLCKWLYYYKVYSLTETNASSVKDIEKRGKGFHLDHIIPVLYGYMYGVDSDIIGSLPNLQMLSLKDNFSKGNFITKEVKDMFSFFNIDYSVLQKTLNPIIKYKPKEVPKENPPKEYNKYSLSLYPNGGDW